MGKLVIKFQGKAVREVNLKLGDMKLGRKRGCDIVLDDPAVSGEHAVVTTIGVKSTVRDLGSKNGTFIENQRVQQHELKHGETIIIGGHSLIYRDAVNLDAPVLAKQPAAPITTSHNVTTELVSFAQLVVVEGKDKGKHLPLIKDAITLENPGKGPARISRSAHGYVVEAAMGPGEPRLNGKPVPPGGQLLENGDVIEVAGAKYEFSK